MQVVIGAGEVGTAVAEVLSAFYEVHLRDLDPSGPDKAETLHICIPWSEHFDEIVTAYRESYEPSLVIVHSTVPVGTCDRLGVVHSPVRGRHPHLAESVRRFVKFFGGAKASIAAGIFEACGVPVAVVGKAKDTEAAKLWELTQYGLQVAIEKQIHEWCEAEGVDFDTVYTWFGETYNEGYQALGEPQFVRPILKHVPGPIGGHCVVPGARMLDHALSDLVLAYGPDGMPEGDVEWAVAGVEVEPPRNAEFIVPGAP